MSTTSTFGPFKNVSHNTHSMVYIYISLVRTMSDGYLLIRNKVGNTVFFLTGNIVNLTNIEFP